MLAYYALYRSSNVKNGCKRQFLSTAHDNTRDFFVSVTSRCPDCDSVHAFAFSRTIMASTPNQRKSLTQWCSRQGVEMEIELTKLS